MSYKKIISYIIAICLLLAISIPSLANNKEGNQISAMKNYEKLIDGLKKNFNEENLDIYGGSFIDEDGNLVINLVDGKDTKELKKVKSLFQVNEVKFRNVKYSLKELDKVQEGLSNKMEQLGISAIERDEVNNKLIVYISEPDDAKIATVQKNAPYDFIEFRPMEVELIFHATDALNGSKIVAGNYSFTLGLGAKKDDGTIGYIGPGHTSAPLNTTVTLNGNTLGILEEKVHAGSADACFIRKTGTTYTPSKFLTTPINTSFRDVFTLYSYPQNSTVYMWGQKSGTTTGIILSSNFTVTIDGVTLTNCVKADYQGAPGDSGGPVCFKNYTTAPYYSVIGNHSAGPAQWIPGTSYCVFSKILYNLNAVDCTLYP